MFGRKKPALPEGSDGDASTPNPRTVLEEAIYQYTYRNETWPPRLASQIAAANQALNQQMNQQQKVWQQQFGQGFVSGMQSRSLASAVPGQWINITTPSTGITAMGNTCQGNSAWGISPTWPTTATSYTYTTPCYTNTTYTSDNVEFSFEPYGPPQRPKNPAPFKTIEREEGFGAAIDAFFEVKRAQDRR